jgi:hypothetical protein
MQGISSTIKQGILTILTPPKVVACVEVQLGDESANIDNKLRIIGYRPILALE